MAIKVGGTTVINNSRGVEGMSGIQGSYDDFHPTVVPISTVLNMLSPCMSVTLSAATTFTATNIQAGRVALLLLDVSSSGHLPTWPASIQWPGNGTEPDWDATGIQTWVVCFTCWDNSTIRATATGWGDAQTASVDLGAQDRRFAHYHMWDDTTNPHGTAKVQMTVQTDGSVAYTTTGSGGSGSDSNFVAQTGTSTWGSGVTGSDYEVNFSYTTTTTGGSVVSTAGNNTWLGLGSNRTWSITTGTSSDTYIQLAGTISIRNASTNAVLSTKAQTIYAHWSLTGMGNTCLTNNMLVQVQGKGLIRVYDLEVGDMIADDSEEMFTKIIDINKDHPREGYYTVDGWLEITHDHPMLIDNNWVLPNDYEGDKQYHKQDTDTVYIETTSGTFSVFNEDGSEHIIVSGDYADKENT